LDSLERVGCGSGVDSMLQFRLERRGGRIKYYQKNKAEAANSSWLNGKEA
jgi:hypothetical protein